MSQGHFALWHSTSASGPTRRVPPPRGSPPRCPPRAFPSSLASSSPLSFYEAFLIPRFVAGGPPSRVAHSPFFTAYLFLAALSYARWLPVPGQMDVFPVCGRPRLLQSFSVCHLFCLHVPRCLVVQGRSDVFPDRVQVHGLFHFCVFLPLLCLRGCDLRAAPPCFVSLFRFLKLSSGVVRRSTFVVCLVSTVQLSWSGQVGWLPSCVQVIGFSQIRGLVVLDFSVSAEFCSHFMQCMP